MRFHAVNLLFPKVKHTVMNNLILARFGTSRKRARPTYQEEVSIALTNKPELDDIIAIKSY